MVSLEYADAYSEVLEILNHISQGDYNKIPKEKITFFEINKNKENNFEYDMKKTLNEQNISKIAKTIIAILFRDYWATDTQKAKIRAKEKYDRLKNYEKYNKKDIFKKNEKNEELREKKVENNLPIEIKKENAFQKIIGFLKKIIKKSDGGY